MLLFFILIIKLISIEDGFAQKVPQIENETELHADVKTQIENYSRFKKKYDELLSETENERKIVEKNEIKIQKLEKNLKKILTVEERDLEKSKTNQSEVDAIKKNIDPLYTQNSLFSINIRNSNSKLSDLQNQIDEARELLTRYHDSKAYVKDKNQNDNFFNSNLKNFFKKLDKKSKKYKEIDNFVYKDEAIVVDAKLALPKSVSSTTSADVPLGAEYRLENTLTLINRLQKNSKSY